MLIKENIVGKQVVDISLNGDEDQLTLILDSKVEIIVRARNGSCLEVLTSNCIVKPTQNLQMKDIAIGDIFICNCVEEVGLERYRIIIIDKFEDSVNYQYVMRQTDNDSLAWLNKYYHKEIRWITGEWEK